MNARVPAPVTVEAFAAGCEAISAELTTATAAISVPPAPAKPWAGPYADEERMSQRWGMGGRPSDWRGD